MIVSTRTPSSLISSSFLPLTFFSCFAPSWASMHSNRGTGSILGKSASTLLIVASLVPQRRSLIRIRRYHPFHCSSVDALRASSIASLASWPVSWRVASKWHSSLNATHGRPCPSGPVNVGTFFTPNVTNLLRARRAPSKNSSLPSIAACLTIASFSRRLLVDSSNLIILFMMISKMKNVL